MAIDNYVLDFFCFEKLLAMISTGSGILSADGALRESSCP
jgi:hypothetical protein